MVYTETAKSLVDCKTALHKQHYEGEPARCRCGQHNGAHWHWWDEGEPEDAHWWLGSCWRCCEIAGMRAKMSHEGRVQFMLKLLDFLEEDEI